MYVCVAWEREISLFIVLQMLPLDGDKCFIIDYPITPIQGTRAGPVPHASL
jgi:hypothetical protein